MRPAIVLLLVVAAASCATERDAARTVTEQDCTKPIVLGRGNLHCK